MNKSILGLSAEQLENGTPADRVLVLKAFYKGDKCTISPVKDMNGRYRGIQENISEVKKLEMGYVPGIESRIKIYDDITIDLNNKEWAADWEWMKHCNEISEDFATGQSTPGAYFYIYRAGFESAKKVSEAEGRVKLMNYILSDSEENLYNRASILGIDMSNQVISDVKEYLLALVESEPNKIIAVYESKTISLELLLMHSLKEKVITTKNGVFIFGEILLGVDKKAVIAFFANPKNHITTKAIEAVTYGQKKKKNPLEDEAVSAQELINDDFPVTFDNNNSGVTTENNSLTSLENSEGANTVAAETTPVAGVNMGGKFITKDTPIEGLTPIQKATRTRLINADKKSN